MSRFAIVVLIQVGVVGRRLILLIASMIVSTCRGDLRVVRRAVWRMHVCVCVCVWLISGADCTCPFSVVWHVHARTCSWVFGKPCPSFLDQTFSPLTNTSKLPSKGMHGWAVKSGYMCAFQILYVSACEPFVAQLVAEHTGT